MCATRQFTTDGPTVISLLLLDSSPFSATVLVTINTADGDEMRFEEELQLTVTPTS